MLCAGRDVALTTINAMERPDVLVLGAGGTIGAAWMSGVLAGIAEATGIDFAAVEHIVGTSAGSMVAADLLAGQEPRAPLAEELAPASDDDPVDGRPGRGAPAGSIAEDDAAAIGLAAAVDADLDGAASDEPSPLNGALRLGGTIAGIAARPLMPFALSLARPASSRIRAALLARIPPPRPALDDLRERIDRHGLQFDGRLRIACVDRESGRRVIFGAPGSPVASVAEAVQASCSVPWTHRPVRIGEREYVDGAIWSPTNLDAAPALRDTHVLCLAPTGGPLGAQPRHPAVRTAATAAAGIELQLLRRRGALVDLVVPAPADPAEHPRVTGYRQGLALAANDAD